MNTTYESKKRLTSVMTAYKHTLALLMSKLRVSLEAAWSMARVWLEYAYSIFITRLRLTHNEITARPSRDYVSSLTRLRLVFSVITSRFQRDYVSFSARFRLVVSLLLFLVLGSGSVWGQDYSGVWYIASDRGYNAETPNNNFFLCPTEGWAFYKATNDVQAGDNGQPFLTTYKCKDGNYDLNKAVWIVEKEPNSGCYYIKQALTGKYIVSNGVLQGAGNTRARVHLETVDDATALSALGDWALFEITYDVDHYDIIPHSTYGRDGDSNIYLVVNTNNYNQLDGNKIKTNGPNGFKNCGGIIGLYTHPDDGNAKFRLEPATIAPPTITNNETVTNTFTITAAEGATIYYTTDGSTPTTSNYTGSGPTPVTVNQTESLTVIKAFAKGLSDYFPTSVTTYDLTGCPKPVITVSGGTVTITCAIAGATIHYTTDGSPATTSSPTYAGPFDKGSASEIRAIATKAGYLVSSEAALLPPTEVSSSDEMTDMSGNYILASNFSSNASIGTSENPFSGTIDGNMVTLSGLDHPLVAYANGATIKNVMLKGVQISGSGSVGAIAGEASGYTRIYNCGILPSSNKYENETSYVSSSNGYCGGLVGWLKDDSRVINCFSYANITGGTTVAGIVGYNNFASTAEVEDGKYTKLKTAVVNCMFYGNITGGGTRYPVYGGNKIQNNTTTGINNYDFYRAEANLGLTDDIHYNCSWPAQEEYLTKYEYYRYLLNSNRELCGWWVGAPSAPSGMSTTDVQAVAKDASLIAKWVLDPSIAPYPILKAPGKYYSAINQDPDNRINPVSKTWESRSTSENTITTKAAPDTEGQKLGSITVTINKGGSLSGSSSKNITITAMDIENNDFCYGKIQLPYYNSIFGDPSVEITGTTDAEKKSQWASRYGGNYGDKVVVGWEITSVTGGTPGTFDNSSEKAWETGYNFADRNCTNKDKERIFAQGGYYYVPNGVSAITITAKWADATYLDNNDNYYDRISKSSTIDAAKGTQKSTFYPFEPAGKRSTTLGNGKNVKTGAISSNLQTGSVYEKAIVLVGNNQNFTGNANYGASSNGFTVMSADFDLDNEPDYSLIWQLGNQTSRFNICPIRFDFLPVIEMGMAMKEDGSTQYYSLGCYRPLGHFEVTETSLIHFGQFEFGNQNRSLEAPLILNGGIYDQFTKGTGVGHAANDDINYMIIGGNVYMPSFTPGAHVNDNANYSTRHCAVNVLGGRINNLYLTGNFNNNVTPNVDNPHCYIDGGNFKQVAAAGKEGINGDVFFKINHSVIEEFYGGSTMDQSTGNNFKTVKGNINVTVDNSKITKYCGGPKFGNMNLNDTDPTKNKTVTTNATGTTFGVYYGGGNGGTSYVQYDKKDITVDNATGTYNWDTTGGLNGYTPNSYRSGGKNYIADYEMEIVNSSAGTDAKKGIFRTYLYAAQFSATNTGPITNNLSNCKVLTSFYGGGNLGGVIGDVTSTLTDTEVLGSAFGAGYSASVPEVTIYNKDKTAPTLNVYTGIITPTPDPDPNSTHETYTWCYKNKTTNVVIPAGVVIPDGVGTGNPTFEYEGKKYFYTEEPLENLGTVTGKATLTINGTTTVAESVYGGGEESGVGGDTEVTVTGGTIGTTGKGGATWGNVYGGGKGKADDVDAGLVKGNTTINISQAENQTTKIIHNVYGGGAFGSVGTFTYDGTTGLPNGLTPNTGTANITITGGTFGSDGKENGMIFGSSRGSEGDPEIDDNIDKIAWVGNTNVVIGTQSETPDLTNPMIAGSVYGGGENGHNYQNGHVTVHSGTIGITDSSVDGGARYSTRGNVYGGGCGTDTFDRGEGDNKKTYYDFNAGIVLGNTQVDIDGGHIVHNVYGGGAMGSVGTYTLADAAYHAEHTDVPVGMPYECKTGTGNCTINITGGLFGMTNATMTGHGNDGPDDFGHIFGAGRGYSKDPNVYPNIESCAFFNNTDLTIGGTALVCGSVYGGSESGHVLNNTNVTISGGQIGCGVGHDTAYTDDDFNSASLPGTAHWTNEANGAPYDQYASPTGTYDYADFPKIPVEDRKASSEGGRPVATDGRTFYGNVFAGGSGYYPYAPGFWLKSAGHIGGTATVTVTGGHILNNLYGGCEMADIDGAVTVTMTGGTVGVPRTKEDITDNPNYGNVYGAGMGDKRIFFNTSTNVASATVNISNGTIYGSVFGGGEDGHVLGNAETTISQPEGKTTVIGCDGLSGNDGNVFGAGQGHVGALTAGVVGGNASLSITGGTMKGSVYGGGRIASVGTYFAMATDPRYGKMQDGDDHGCLTVSLTGGTIEQNVYGGCMGTTANVLYGESKNVLVELNKGKTGTDKGCIVKGDIFGCNNVNGTPQGDVEVHVYATQNADVAATQIANSGEVTTAKVKGRYDVRAVYGGGNLATYNPVTPYDGNSGSKTKVIIEGCDLSSIETVYGGGNAAAVPETDVYIKSAYEIRYLFGGGNGKDDIAPGVENPGADVGTPDHGTSTYGTGNANTLMEGGLIHEAYGGSNTKGIIKGSIFQITDPKDPSVDPGCCELVVEKIVGAGKYADVDGDVNMTLSCQPERKVNLLFAGADEANVNGNITLNITNGHFGKVFGGNNLGGAIKGKITVNVEETGCQPIKIDNLYLGSNEAAYSVFGYYESDEIHDVTGKKILKPRTSADDSHTPVENPATDETHTFPYAQPELNIISCTYIGNVFGGGFGEGAIMYANPTVNVNMVKGLYGDDEDKGVPKVMTELGLDVTKTAPNPDKLGIIRNVYGGGDAADIVGNTTVNIATEANKGAYIIGSVFGGGNAADVLGNTNVTVSGGYVFNGIFGGGFAGSVGTFTRSTAAADVNIYGHTTHDGCIGKPVSCATGTGKCTVLVNGGQIGPLSVATQGMNRSKADGGPVPEGWVWGAGQGLVEDPATHPDTHFTSYVGETDVTIKGTALIMESIIGGGEFGRVLGNTLVKIEGGQIGIGEGKVDDDNKPIRYTDDQFVNPLTTPITNANALTECSHYPYGKVIGGKKQYLPYDPYYDDNKTYADAHDLGPASTSDPSDGKTWIGCVFGGGSGYMPYKNASGYEWVRSAGWVEGNSEVRISGGHILTNVYGGNEVTDVKGKSIVKMTGGTIGVPRTLEQIAAHPVTCYLFGAGKGDDRSHFYNYTNVGSVEVEVSGGIIYGSVFGGSEDGHVTGDIKVDIKPGAIIGTWGTSYVDGNVFGAGRGFSGNTLTAGNVGGNVTLNISGGNILGSVYGGGRLASVGTYLVPSTDANYGKLIPDDGDDKHGHITINITGGTIGNDKEYIYNPTAEQKAAIPNTTFDYQNHLQYTKGGNVFTAGMGRLYALDNTTVLTSWKKLGQCKQTVLNMTGGTVKSSVYGGGEIGIVAQNATLNINGGTVGTKVVDSEDATKYYYFGSVFGGGKGSTANVEGISEAGTTQGNVEVHLNQTVASNDAAKGAIVSQVFGCNDMNGSPKGNVTVHVYATQNADKDNIGTKYDKETNQYDVEAVYGGGNLAAYEPEGGKNTTKSTNVIIDGCGLTSIKQVYGGGNAASTPATNVTVNGTYEIMELFGGGNGFDKLPDGKPNPGANVGYKNYTIYEEDGDNWVAKDDPDYDTKEERTAPGSAITYGTGQASLNVFGGTIHRVFGGSNTKGNVRKTAVTMLEEVTEGGLPVCEFHVDEAYGGGKSALMDAEAKLLMACIPGLEEVYGGAQAADIHDDVTLTITNGTFNRVFGGNNLSGTIDGSITVNVEEVGCRPIIIGELYGGGNLAAYSIYGYDDDDTPKTSGENPSKDPEINVKSFTSIGSIYGGGYGEKAVMVGSPTVNINEVADPESEAQNKSYIVDAQTKYYSDYAGETKTIAGHSVILPSHVKGKMGSIYNVFGGGNAAMVKGNTTVNIGTTVGDDIYMEIPVKVGDTLPADCYTKSGNVYTPASGEAAADTDYYKKYTVLGVDIRDNVYGGGNNAEVTGNANVNIGKKVTP